jgi:transposase InsO family protein
MSTGSSASTTTITKLNPSNYRAWALDMKDVLKQLSLWRIVTGEERVPIPPAQPPIVSEAAGRTIHHPIPDLKEWDFKPESDDEKYLQRYEKFMSDYEKYQEKRIKACGTICLALEPSIRARYRADKFEDDPQALWNAIKSDFEEVIKLDGKHEQQKLATCKLEDYPSVNEWIAAQEKIINDLAICGISVTDEWRVFYIMSNLPTSPEWLGFTTSMNISGKADTPSSIITQLQAFEANLRRQKGLSPGAALFVTRKQRNQAQGRNDPTHHDKTKSGHGPRQRIGNSEKTKSKCYGCGIPGHSKRECRHPERWEAYAKQQADAHRKGRESGKATDAQANLVKTEPSSTDSEPKETFLFAALRVNPVQPTETRVFSTYTVHTQRSESASKFTASDWIIDTGASNHITGNRSLFSAYRAYAPGEHLVRTANNHVVSAAGVGTVPIRLGRRTILLRSVLHVPDCGNNNLLSILQLLRKGMKVDFDADKATLKANCRNLGVARVQDDLFILRSDGSGAATLRSTNSSDVPVVFANAAISQKPDENDILLWHARLGHLSLPAIKRAATTVDGLKLHARSPSDCICEACILGKMSRRPFSKESGQRPVTRPLELIHTDVVGPMPTQSRKGFRYLIMLTDDATRYTYIYFLRQKSEVTAVFKQFKAEVEKIHGLPIIRVRMDGGGEYSSDELLTFLRKEGIQVEPSAPYTPQQNGTSERCNRTVMDPVRSMLKHAGMPNSFWADAAKVAVYIKNRLPTRALPNTTPFEAWHGTGKKPDLSHLRIFGSLAYAWTSPALRKKLDDRAKKAILIGYTATTQQYLLYDIASRREFLARDIRFNEGCLYSQLLGSGTASSSVTFEIPENTAPALPSVPAATTSTASELEDDASQQLQLEAAQQPPSPVSPPPPGTPPPARSTPGEWLDTESVLSDCPDPYAEPEVPRSLRIDMNTSPPKTNTRTRSGRALLSTALMVEPGPKTYRAALKTPDAEEWTAAVNTEIAALDSHQALEFIPEDLPVSSKATVVNSRWLLSKKFKATGEIDKYKARLIAQGFTQKEGLDFDANAISSPVVDSSTIRLCLGLAAQHNLQIAILDCPTAFLGSTLHETIYLRLPEGNWQHRDPWKRDRPLVRLRKTLYGLKQSARGWFEDVYEFLVTQNLTASVAAPGLFLGDGIIVLVYVDDIMILAATIEKLRTLCDALHRRFRAAPPKDASIPIGDHFQYVGLDIQLDRQRRIAYINQSGYIAKVLEQFGMSDCRPRYTPMEEGLKFGTGECWETISCTRAASDRA